MARRKTYETTESFVSANVSESQLMLVITSRLLHGYEIFRL